MLDITRLSKRRYNKIPKVVDLVHDLAVERNTHGTQQKSCILVGLGGSVESDVATGDHLRRIPMKQG